MSNVKKEMKPVREERLQRLLERAVSYYEQSFPKSEGRTRLEGMGITDAGLYNRHRIGYANGSLKDILPSDGALKDELVNIGVFAWNGRERVYRSIVFPVVDSEGRLANLCGYHLQKQSYLCLPNRSKGIWNLPAIKTYTEILATTSILDALSLMMAGKNNTIAFLDDDVADKDLATLKEYGVKKVTIVINDCEARSRKVRCIKRRLADFYCNTKQLPPRQTINGILRKEGAQKLAQLIAHDVVPLPDNSNEQNAPNSLTVIYGLRKYQVMGLEKRARALRATVKVNYADKMHVDTLDFYSARSRRFLVQDICRVFDEGVETIEGDIEKLIKHCEQLSEEQVESSVASIPQLSINSGDRKTAERLGRNRNIFSEILKDYLTVGLVGEENNKLACYLAMTSRKMDEPLCVLILSSSGAGKTILQDTTLKFCPPEDLLKLTSLSGKALFYKEQTSLKNKVLALEEDAGVEDATYAIRNLISSQQLTIESTIRDPASGRITTMLNRVEGNTSVFVTTTNPETDAETRSRFVVIAIDESKEQTKRILIFQRKRQTLYGFSSQANIDAIIKKHQNFQRMLKPFKVVNPFAEKLTYGDDRLPARRNQAKYLSLIRAVCFVRQMQKEIKVSAQGKEYIEVDHDDISIANNLAYEIFGKNIDDMSSMGRELLQQIYDYIHVRAKQEKVDPSDITFTRRQLREHTGWSNTRLHIHLKELADYEYLIIESGRNGISFNYGLSWDGKTNDNKPLIEIKERK